MASLYHDYGTSTVPVIWKQYASVWSGAASTASTASTDSDYYTWGNDGPRVEVIERIPKKLPAGKRTLELPDGANLEPSVLQAADRRVSP